MEFFIESPNSASATDFQLAAPQHRFYISCPSGCEAHSQAYLLFGVMLKHVCATIYKLYDLYSEEIFDGLKNSHYWFDMKDFAGVIKNEWNTKFLTAKDCPSWAGPLNGSSESFDFSYGRRNYNLNYAEELGTRGWRFLNTKRLYLLSIDFLIEHGQCHTIKSTASGRWVFRMAKKTYPYDEEEVFNSACIIKTILLSPVPELAECLLSRFATDIYAPFYGEDVHEKNYLTIGEEEKKVLYRIKTEVEDWDD